MERAAEVLTALRLDSREVVNIMMDLASEHGACQNGCTDITGVDPMSA